MQQSLTQEVRNYVKKHNNCVTSKEVINYILNEKNIDTTEESIRRILLNVLKETGGVLKKYGYGISEEIRNYIKKHGNCVTSKEVVNYILNEKNIDAKEDSIRAILSYILKETGGTYRK